MQWLPTYMTRTLGAEKSHIMFTAVPYIMNSLVGMGKNAIFTNVIFFFLKLGIQDATRIYIDILLQYNLLYKNAEK